MVAIAEPYLGKSGTQMGGCTDRGRMLGQGTEGAAPDTGFLGKPDTRSKELKVAADSPPAQSS